MTVTNLHWLILLLALCVETLGYLLATKNGAKKQEKILGYCAGTFGIVTMLGITIVAAPTL